MSNKKTMSTAVQNQLRQLPAVDELLQSSVLSDWQLRVTHERLKEQIQHVLNERRQQILADDGAVAIDATSVLEDVVWRLEHMQAMTLMSCINATGTVLHTNLGRALLADEAVEAMSSVAQHYNNLEYDIAGGKRGSRYTHLQAIIKELTGAEDVLVVNNNAAAVMLYLTALVPTGSEILISRGELVEIGDSFRIPDVIQSAGAVLKEVGATNKTHLKDFERALSEETGALLRVHTSNYRIVGFHEMVADEAVVELAHAHQLPAFKDLGSGLLINLEHLGLPQEPTVSESLEAGYDVVSFSGDKLLGGPQAGIIVGKKRYIEKLKKHPLLRALRVDKFTIAALEKTLTFYLNPARAMEKIPTLRMLSRPLSALEQAADSLKEQITAHTSHYEVTMIDGQSQIGGGSYPGTYLPTKLVAITSDLCHPAELEAALRLSDDHIIARVQDEQVQFDVRTLSMSDSERIVERLHQIEEAARPRE
ncbi:MAG: L-seryl-tRNA(Sec) selenium transferase [Aerococcus sp.]|nr:L-seryl-tRNA(Sec) selenium transferase [Aerococcus sp.]